jgi:hypothetical protein
MTVQSYDQYNKAIIYNHKACSVLASVVNLALVKIINYNNKLCSKLKRNLRSLNFKKIVVQATASIL